MAENEDTRHDETPDLKDVVALKDAEVIRFEMEICTDDVCYLIKASDGKLVVEPAEPEIAEKEGEPGQDLETKEEE